MTASHVQTVPDAPQAAQSEPEHTISIQRPCIRHRPSRRPYSASPFHCGTIRRAVDAQHDRAGLLARFHRVTPVDVAMETATCPECGSQFERRAGQDHPRRYCASRCYQRAYNRAGKALRQRAKQGWAA